MENLLHDDGQRQTERETWSKRFSLFTFNRFLPRPQDKEDEAKQCEEEKHQMKRLHMRMKTH